MRDVVGIQPSQMVAQATRQLTWNQLAACMDGVTLDLTQLNELFDLRSWVLQLSIALRLWLEPVPPPVAIACQDKGEGQTLQHVITHANQ